MDISVDASSVSNAGILEVTLVAHLEDYKDYVQDAQQTFSVTILPAPNSFVPVWPEP